MDEPALRDTTEQNTDRLVLLTTPYQARNVGPEMSRRQRRSLQRDEDSRDEFGRRHLVEEGNVSKNLRDGKVGVHGEDDGYFVGLDGEDGDGESAAKSREDDPVGPEDVALDGLAGVEGGGYCSS